MTRWWFPLACGLAQVVSFSVGPSTEPPGWATAASAVVGLAAGLALVARDRAPLVVLFVATVGQVVQVWVAQPVFPVVTTVAAFTVARSVLPTTTSPVGPIAALTGSVLAVAGTVALAGHPDIAAFYAVLLLLGILTGLTLAVRASRAAARRRELVHAERLRIARDLHDTVGHGIGAITVQAGAGRLAIAAGSPDDATRALTAIEDAGRAILRDVRWMVGLLREERDHVGLAGIGGLVDTARRAGLAVTRRSCGDLTAVSAAVGEAAFRIVQEAITNVLRHSAAGAAQVLLTVDGGGVELRVHDPGPARADTTGVGYGLPGMRERAATVGGRVVAGPDPDVGGWTVRVWLPVEGRPG
jgi:signal transduction histidine kinase